MKKLVLTLICILTAAGIASAQVSKIKGTVIFDDDKSPVIGASVFIKGTTVGTTTDIDGKFTLTGVPSDAKSVVISFIGMQTEEVAVKPEINVSLKSGTETIEEAVVTIAYGAAKKSSLTGAVASVDAEKIESRITSDVASALEGSVAGVQVNSTYGAPGESATIRIRGIGTINGDANPLYVVDGVPYDGDSADLNPADIESVSVLKDAASAALYGNRASNGVVLITTKKGTSGKIQMKIDVKQGIYMAGLDNYSTMGVHDWMEFSWMNMRNYYVGNGYDKTAAANYACNYLIQDRVKNNIYNKADNELFTQDGKLVPDAQILPGYADDLDWYKDAFRIGWRQEYNLRGSGGTDNSDYYFSLGYLNEQGYVTNADFDRLSLRAVVNTKPFKWIKTGVNLYGSYSNTNHTDGSDDAEYTNYYGVCRQMAPVYPVHVHNIHTGEYELDANGQKKYSIGYWTDENGYVQTVRNQYEDRNIIWENIANSNNTRKTVINGTGYVDIYFLKDFTFTVKGNVNLRSNINTRYNSPEIGASRGIGTSLRYDRTYTKITLQQQLRWSHQFHDHSVSALVAHETYDYTFDYLFGKKQGEIIAGQQQFANYSQISDLDSYKSTYRTESYLSRLRYNYREKYNLEGSFRRDGSSRFSPDARWGNFWSIGANWMISHEDFMSDADWLNTLKLRADYGEVGNDAGANYYSYMDLYSIDHIGKEGALYFSQHGSPDLQWETSQSWGVGIESRMFGIWNLNIEYFDKRNKDLLFDVYNPLSAGATKLTAYESVTTKNLGTISNRGIELETDIDVLKNRNWKINLAGNITWMKNEVMSLPEGNENGISTYSARQRIAVGHPLHAWYLYQWAGIDQMTGRSLYHCDMDNYCITDNGSASGNVIFGTPAYDPSGKITNLFPKSHIVINGKPYTYFYTYAKRDFAGSAHPDFFGSFSANIKYKQWNLSAMCTYSIGGYTYDTVYKTLMSSSTTTMRSYHTDMVDRAWIGIPVGMTEESPDRIDPEAKPIVSSYYSSNSNATSTQWLISSSYLIIKNVKLAYNFKKKVCKSLNLRGLSISATGENLATFAARDGLNPQQTTSGVHGNVLVTPRIITLDLSIKF